MRATLPVCTYTSTAVASDSALGSGGNYGGDFCGGRCPPHTTQKAERWTPKQHCIMLH